MQISQRIRLFEQYINLTSRRPFTQSVELQPNLTMKVLLIVAVVVIAASEAKLLPFSPKELGRKVLCGCPPWGEPVCDKNGQKWRSMCALKCKDHPEVEHDPEGKCLKEKPKLCGCLGYGLNPVCDTEGRKWPNKCELECRNAKYDPQAKCLEMHGKLVPPSEIVGHGRKY